jgi:hypothetical protein
MNTMFLLMAQFDGKTAIPVAAVCRDFFSHLSPEKFMRKVGLGEIALPVIRMEGSNKAAPVVDVRDLAAYLDARRKMAVDDVKRRT